MLWKPAPFQFLLVDRRGYIQKKICQHLLLALELVSGFFDHSTGTSKLSSTQHESYLNLSSISTQHQLSQLS